MIKCNVMRVFDHAGKDVGLKGNGEGIQLQDKYIMNIQNCCRFIISSKDLKRWNKKIKGCKEIEKGKVGGMWYISASL